MFMFDRLLHWFLSRPSRRGALNIVDAYWQARHKCTVVRVRADAAMNDVLQLITSEFFSPLKRQIYRLLVSPS